MAKGNKLKSAGLMFEMGYLSQIMNNGRQLQFSQKTLGKSVV